MSSNTIKESQEYANKVNNIEAQIITQDETHLLVKESFISDECCGKICIAVGTTVILSPFPICDLYYAFTDNTCVTQSQTNHHLTITLKSYLMVSGFITLSIIAIFNFCLFLLDCNVIFPNKKNNENYFCEKIIEIIFRVFGLAWLILGCVLFWAYTDISNCSDSLHDYLFARLILGIISYVVRIYNNKE